MEKTLEGKEKIISLIKKCLAKGDSEKNDSISEVETALAMANKLMLEHNIAMTDIEFSDGKLKEEIEEEVIRKGNLKDQWESVLMVVLEKLCSVSTYYKCGPGYQKITFVGTKEDIEIAKTLFKSLQRKIRIMVKFHMGHKKSYAFGITVALHNKADALLEKNKTVMPENTSALILVKNQGIQDFMKKLNMGQPRLKSKNLNELDVLIGLRDGQSLELETRKEISNG